MTHPDVFESFGGGDVHYRGCDSQPEKPNGGEIPGQRPARSRWFLGFGPDPFEEEKGSWDYRPKGILVFFLTKVQSSSTWTWESLMS